MKKRNLPQGFSLVEVMFAMTIMALASVGVMTFYVQSGRAINSAEQRTLLAGQIKSFTNELIVQGSRANQFVMFKTAAAGDRDGPNPAVNSNNSDRQNIAGVGAAAGLHPAGDFVVFVYYEIPKPATQAFHRILKLEGYYLDPVTGGIGPVRKVAVVLTTPYACTSTNVSTAVEDILTAHWSDTSTTKFSICFAAARSLILPEVIDGTPVTGATTPRLFYMSDAHNVIVSGQLFSSNLGIQTSDRRTSTASFYFTITPRT